jgi:hypothetical protein
MQMVVKLEGISRTYNNNFVQNINVTNRNKASKENIFNSN